MQFLAHSIDYQPAIKLGVNTKIQQCHVVTNCYYKKLSYRRGTARCVVSVEILPIATQECRNYLYCKS